MDLVLNERCLGFSCFHSAALAVQLGHRGVCGDKMKPPNGAGWVCGQGAAGAEISERSCWFEGFLMAFFLPWEAAITCCSESCVFTGVLCSRTNQALEEQCLVWVKTAASADVEINLVVRTGLGV